MHYAGNDTYDLWTQELQRNLIKMVKPDLVVVSGDAVSGYLAQRRGGYEKFWRKFTGPMMEAQVPYAYILGNHDAEGDLDSFAIVDLDSSNPFSVRKGCEGIPHTTNFIQPVYSSRNEDELAANIWMFDTGSTVCEGFEYSWGCLEKDKIEWYDQESKRIKEEHGNNIHHLAFLHIPIPEFRTMYNNHEIYGVEDDDIGCPFVNTGFFDHVRANGDISAMFVGHDHTNEFGGWYEGVELVYGRKSGFNAYGDILGARVIMLKENYNENGDLNVTRSHFIMGDDGSVVLPEPLKPRQGARKLYCGFPGAVYAWKVIVKKVFWEIGHFFKGLMN